MPLNNEARAQQLLDELGVNIASLQRGEAIYADLKRSVRRMRIMTWVAVIGMVLDISLTVAFGVILNEQSHLQQQVSDNQSTIHEAECNLNTLFISADTPEQRAKASNAARYDAQYHVIYQQRVQLGCQPPIAEPVR
jgi:hypothetical protein